MAFLHTVRNYLLYCGIEKDEYKALKKDAYVSNFKLWRVLHCLVAIVFTFLFIASLLFDMLAANRYFYLIGTIYAVAVTCLFFFVLKQDSIIAQLIIYLTISWLFLFAALIAQNRPDTTATTFFALMLLAPMFMVDKPYFMAIVLTIASTVYLIWMRGIKLPDIWSLDHGNMVIFLFVGIFIHVIANAIRIKEFVLTRKIAAQRDTDDLTDIKNKAAVTRAINAYLADETKTKGLMFLLDINHFKDINDTYGHDVGDDVIRQFGSFLKETFPDNDIVGRFGGDEFIVFIEDTDDQETAERIAQSIVDGSAEYVKMPSDNITFSVSAGIAVYRGAETNYSEIFKKADIALYGTKSDRSVRYLIAD